MNRPPLLQAVEGPRRRVGVAQLPRSRPLRGAKLKELERWSEPYKRVGFENAARAITAAHMVPAARLVRLADHMVLGALLRLPVEAVQALRARFTVSHWRKLARDEHAPPLLQVAVERDDGPARLKLRVPAARTLTLTPTLTLTYTLHPSP